MSETYKSALEFIRWNYPTEKHERLKLSTDKAIEALEKQIPKKINRKNLEESFKCPRCNSDKYWKEDLWCRECGQRLDWSDLSERD